MGLFRDKTLNYEDDTTKAVTDGLEGLLKKTRQLESRSVPLNNFTPSVSRLMHSQIEKLKSANNKMQKQLTSDSASLAWLTEQKACAEIETHETDDTKEEWFNAVTQDKQERLDQLERLAEEFYFGIMERRKAEGGIYASKEARDRDLKQCQILEHRLHRARIDFNRRITANRSMRQTIHELRVDRVMVERMIAHILRQTDKLVTQITETVERANTLAAARDDSTAVVAELKYMAEREHRQFQDQWRELGRLVSYNDKIVNFIATLSDGKLVKEKEKWAQGQEMELRKVLTAAAWDIAKDKACMKMTRARVDAYRQQFDRLRQAIGVDTFDEIINVFETCEDRNFHKFQMVNLLNADIDDLDEKLEELRLQWDALSDAKRHGDAGYVVDGRLRERLVSQTSIERLGDRLASVQRELDELNEKAADQGRTMANMRNGISKILKLFGDVEDPLVTTPVTETTLVDHLAFMEEQICRILQQWMMQENMFTSDVHIRNDFNTTCIDEDMLLLDATPHVILPSTTSSDDLDSINDEQSDHDDQHAPFLTSTKIRARPRSKPERDRCV